MSNIEANKLLFECDCAFFRVLTEDQQEIERSHRDSVRIGRKRDNFGGILCGPCMQIKENDADIQAKIDSLIKNAAVIGHEDR